MKKIRNLTIEEYTKKATEKKEVSLWGGKYEFKPYLCEKKLGDGLQLIAIGTIFDRPYYWLVLIDSNTDVDADDFDYEDIIVEVIRNECGACDEDYCEECNDSDDNCAYPAICPSGCYWCCIANFSTGYENTEYDYLKIEREFEVKYLLAKCGARYWEDATVNDVEDTEGTLIPCREGGYWKPLINLETGIIENWEIGKKASIHYKCCDDGEYFLLDENKKIVKSIEGYVPTIMYPAKNGYGDYVIMDIDENGKIDKWKVVLDEFLDEEE